MAGNLFTIEILNKFLWNRGHFINNRDPISIPDPFHPNDGLSLIDAQFVHFLEARNGFPVRNHLARRFLALRFHNFCKTGCASHFFLDARAGNKGATSYSSFKHSFFNQKGNSLPKRHPTHLKFLSQIAFARKALPDFPYFLINLRLNLIMDLNVSWNHNLALSLCYLYCSVKFLILQSEIGKDKAFVLE